MTEFTAVVRRFMVERGMSLRALARASNYDPGLLSKVLNGHRPYTPYLAARLDRALGAGGQIEAAGQEPLPRPSRRTRQQRQPSRAVEAIQTVIAGDPDGADVASDSLGELVSHYAGVVSMAPSPAVYDELLAVRSYAGTLLSQSRARKRLELTVTVGWLSSLLAVSTTDLGDHAAAVIWCADAERRGVDAGYPELLGWSSLTRAVIAYYGGRAVASADLASHGQALAPLGTTAHARLVAQEMRSHAMLGDVGAMAGARQRAVTAMEQLSPGTPVAGVFGVPRDADPPYTATSLLMVGRYKEAAAVTRRLIETVYQPKARAVGEQPTNYARTLLILALAMAGIGDAKEAAAVGSAALECGRIVWPTMVLATRLDGFLAATASGAAGADDYRARFAETRKRLVAPASRRHVGKGAG
jgi:transcriptional regulator with XRE-family HTH domain